MAMMGMCWPGGFLDFADGGGGFEAVHLGHLHVHQHDIESSCRFDGLDGLLPVFGDGDLWPRLESMRTANSRLMALSSASRMRSGRRASRKECRVTSFGSSVFSFSHSQHLQHGFPQFHLANRLGQIGGDAHFAAAVGVAALPARGEHHDRGGRQSGSCLIFFRQRETVHAGHLRVQQQQR